VVSVNTDSLRYTFNPEAEFEGCLDCLDREGVGEFEVKLTASTVTHYQSGIALIEETGKPPTLRRRGKPLLTAAMLKGATGPVLSVPSKRVTHLFEGLAQHRTADIGAFDDPNDPGDDTKIDLNANRWALDFSEPLRFEVLNQRPVFGSSPPWDSVVPQPLGNAAL